MPDTSGLLTQFYLTIAGADATEEFMRALLDVSVENSLHLPDVATVTVHDPQLRWTDDDAVAPGKTLRISARSERQTSLLFDGEIVELEPDFTASTQQLIIRAFDRLHRLARGRQVRSFLNVSDGDLVRKIAQESNLQAQVGPAAHIYPYVLQGNETNLDFLRGRAAALGYLLYVQGDTLHFEAPHMDGVAVELEWGASLTEFHPRLSTVDQVDSVTVRGWDPDARQEIVGKAENGQGAPAVGEPRSGAALAHEAFHLAARDAVTNRPVRTQAVADQLAQAVANRRAMRFIEAEGSGAGNPAIVAGSSIRISAIGQRFSGTYFITGATHTYSADHGYSTRFSISGLHPVTLLNLLAPQREVPVPAGLVVGIVTDNQDPQGQGRVKVKFPWLSGEHASDWARLVTPGGGAERGMEFLPEVNDEVIVGFELGDIHYPYVLGGLWNGRDAPPTKSDQLVSGGQVQKRIIRSRSGHVITLDDSEGGGGISIVDKNGNKIVLDAGTNALTVELSGNAEIKAQGNLTLEAQGEVQIKGMGITIDGGPGTVDVKGSMINLN